MDVLLEAIHPNLTRRRYTSQELSSAIHCSMSSIPMLPGSIGAAGGVGAAAPGEEGGSTPKALCILRLDLVNGRFFILGSVSFFNRK